jgi:hypothetical protein
MSRNLPPHPSLEHLRNQAKGLLPELRRENPTARLADAQYQIARAYGFASWPKLKRQVESLHAEADRGPSGRDNGLHVFAGQWKADLIRSNPAPGFPFRDASLAFEVGENTLTVVDTLVDATGSLQHTNTIRVDAGDSSQSQGAYNFAARLRGRSLSVRVTRGGSLEGEVSYVVSADGDRLRVVTGNHFVEFDRVR